MNLTFKSGAVLALVVALGVFGGLQLNVLANTVVNKAKTVPPAKTA